MQGEPKMADINLEMRLQGLKAVCVLSGGTVKAERPDHLGGLGYRSLWGNEQPLPSYERVLAAAELYRMNPKLQIMFTGGVTNTAAEGPHIAEVMSAEIRQLGIPAAQIILETQGINIWYQLVYSAALARTWGWAPEELALSSLGWHSNRIMAMILNARHALEPRDMHPFVPGRTPYLSTERVLIAADAYKWTQYFINLYARPEFAPVWAGEVQGVGQLWAGSQPAYPRPYRGFRDPLARP
jgi:uncharacterized SAM-binding protein YcdF (DUF218 family)